jgi:aspartyl-tRNA(Asn)/glutamyl-tRNA(Gln) amidotransferase subunit A
MSEFAFSGLGANPHYPPCGNPHDRARVPGGSSSGAAVSVALGAAAVGLGTDTGGSTRIPAAFCGVVGFKPTQARVTREGAFPLSETLDSIGPLANSVACCALVDRLIADGPAVAAHPPLGVAGLRFGVPNELVLDGMDDAVARAFERALSRLAQAGALVSRVSVPAFARIPEINAKGGIVHAEASAIHTRTGLFKQRERYDPNVAARIDIGARMTAGDYIELLRARAAVIAEVARVSAAYDALVFPSTPTVAPRFDEIAEAASFGRLNALALRNPGLVNFLDRCALSLPMHEGDELPSGLMLVGEHMGDARLFAVGAAVETALGRRI